MDIHILASQFFNYSIFIRGYSKATVRRYRQSLFFYCKFAQITQLHEVTEKSLGDFFMYGRVERNWKPNTYIMLHLSLTVFFKWCIRNKYLTKNPLQDFELPKVEKRLPVKLTKQEALTLLDVVYHYPYKYHYLQYRNHAIFSLFIFTGIRRSELLNLKFADVDIENLSLFIRRGKGNKDRIIPLCPALANTLKRYIVDRKRLRKTCPEFFASLQKNMGFTNEGMKHLVIQIRKATRIKFSIHKLRHTFATLMLEGGCDIYSLSKMMGHADIKTTTIYLAASAEHLRTQIMKHPLVSDIITTI